MEANKSESAKDKVKTRSTHIVMDTFSFRFSFILYDDSRGFNPDISFIT